MNKESHENDLEELADSKKLGEFLSYVLQRRRLRILLEEDAQEQQERQEKSKTDPDKENH